MFSLHFIRTPAKHFTRIPAKHFGAAWFPRWSLYRLTERRIESWPACLDDLLEHLDARVDKFCLARLREPNWLAQLGKLLVLCAPLGRARQGNPSDIRETKHNALLQLHVRCCDKMERNKDDSLLRSREPLTLHLYTPALVPRTTLELQKQSLITS